MGKKRVLKKLALGFLLIFSLFFVFADSGTYLEVPNAPPELIKEIPNQSWQENTFLENSFDLDDYFIDPEMENITYNYSLIENISVLINENNSVSFLPDTDFFGTRTLLFYAHDSVDYSESNLVYLNVGIDTLAPNWSNPRKDKEKIYQNDFVVFNVTWTDNFELSNYTFYINQGESWTQTSSFFSGRVNDSSNRVQISAPAGRVVEWKVCASDSVGNLACSDIFNFDVLVSPTNPPSSEDNSDGSSSSSSSSQVSNTISSIIESVTDLFANQSEPDFNLNSESFLVSLKQGSGLTKIFEITNTGGSTLSFNLSVENLGEFVKLSEESFELLPGKSKRITVDFNAQISTLPGEYYGYLVVDSFKQVKVPLAININQAELEFEVNVEVLESYKLVKPGKMVVAKINLTNVKDKIPTNVSLYYSIKDFQGRNYDSFEENILFEDSLIVEKKLNISEELFGEYLFYVRAYNTENSAIDSDLFEVGYRFNFAAFLKTSSIFFSIFILSILLLFLVLKEKKRREKERILNLYVKLNELKDAMKEGKYEEAAKLYISIKRFYGEPVSPSLLEDKAKLIESIGELAKKIDFDSVPTLTNEVKNSEKKSEEENKENGKEEEETKENEGSKEKIPEESKKIKEKNKVPEAKIVKKNLAKKKSLKKAKVKREKVQLKKTKKSNTKKKVSQKPKGVKKNAHKKK